MKIFKLLLPLFIMLTVWPCELHADPRPPLPVMLTPGTREDEEPDKGKRTAPAPVMCVIDFSALEIMFSETDAVICYELLYEEGTGLIASYTDESDMVKHLTGLSGTFQLRLVAETSTYIGYLLL